MEYLFELITGVSVSIPEWVIVWTSVSMYIHLALFIIILWLPKKNFNEA